ncbi:MAG: P-loop NTPase fold protein, partial [Verrucomicrobiota bacterium]
MFKDNELEWLHSYRPEKDTIPVTKQRIRRILRLFSDLDTDKLPYTIGLFGGWGSGKTSLLDYLAEDLQSKGDCRVVYFNAWKHAAFMEVVPALVYRILSVADQNKDGISKVLGKVLLSLGSKYSDIPVSIIKQYTGVDVKEIW